jgi:hypothetical protein
MGMVQRCFRRAWDDTWPFFGSPKSLFIGGPLAFAAGSLVHIYKNGWSAVMDEFSIWLSYGLSGLAGAAAVVFLYNLVIAPYRIQRDRAEAAESQLALGGDSRGGDDLIALRSGKYVEFDCSKGRNFHFTQNDQTVTVKPPLNPVEGTYRLYIQHGKSLPHVLMVQGYTKWNFANVNSETREGDITLYEITILKQNGEYLYFSNPLFHSGPEVHHASINAEYIKCGEKNSCRRAKAYIGQSALHYAAFDCSTVEQGLFDLVFPVEWSVGEITMSVSWSFQSDIADEKGAVFAIFPQGRREEAVHVSGIGKPGRKLISNQSEPFYVTVLGVNLPYQIEREVTDPDDTAPVDVHVHSINLKCVVK